MQAANGTWQTALGVPVLGGGLGCVPSARASCNSGRAEPLETSRSGGLRIPRSVGGRLRMPESGLSRSNHTMPTGHGVHKNSCVHVVPGSPRSVVPHVQAGAEMTFREEADPASVEQGTAVHMVLRPGNSLFR